MSDSTIGFGNKFAVDLNASLGDKMRADEEFCKKVWSALANVSWWHADGTDADYSFRLAGRLIASIRGEGDYLDWYCCAEPEIVDPEISQPMALLGWTPKLASEMHSWPDTKSEN